MFIRKRISLLVPIAILVAGCVATNPTVPTTPTGSPTPYGMTLEEEARILQLEDRRELDPALTAEWAHHPNSLHRARIALALARIGNATFLDADGNGVRDAGEKMAGVDILAAMAGDSDANVRRTVAFALGEIGDPAGSATLTTLAGDRDNADVAAEAVEGLAKMAKQIALASYSPWTGSEVREGVRARAVRYLFRFDSDDASSTAAGLLDSSSTLMRREAAYSLSRRKFAPARPRLELLLSDGDTLTRAYAAQALGSIGETASINVLVASVGDAHPWVRTNSLRALARIGDKNETSSRLFTTEQAIKLIAVSDDPDPGTRVTAIDALAYAARTSALAKKRLLDIAVNGDRWQREVAAGAVARLFGDDPDKPLQSLLATDNPWIEVRAAEGSAKLRSGAALRRKLAGSNDRMVRSAAIGAIPDDAIDQEIEVITAALSDEDPVVRGTAIERNALSKAIALPNRVAVLLEAESRGSRDQEMNDARLAAIQALAAIEFPERESFLRERVSDRDPVVRRMAATLLEEKAKKPRPQFTPLPIERPLSEYVDIVRWARERHTATIELGRGEIQLALLSQDAPMTAWNFAQLAKRHYFDNTSFMRVVPNFVVQGGDPRNDMNGGPGYAIRDEINLQKYTRGAVGMALSGADTGGSQFFIAHSPQPHLDGGYTIFARVIGGMGGVVDQTERGDEVKHISIDTSKPATVDFSAVEKIPLPTEVGPITPARLLEAVPEYTERKGSYAPDADALALLAAAVAPKDHIDVFLGTWCPDSQREVPKLLKILDTLKGKFGVELPATFVAVNRDKKEPARLLAGRDVEKVATIIYIRDGKELGRVVEQPAGLLEDDMLQIVAGKR